MISHLSCASAFFSLFAGHEHNSTLHLWSKQEQAPKAGADGMRLCSTELCFSELVKNEKSQAQNWSDVSLWWKQIDRRSRWIQSWLIRWILWDSWALPNTAHPLLPNPHQIPTQSCHILQSNQATLLEKANAKLTSATHMMKLSFAVAGYSGFMSNIGLVLM